MDIRIEIDQKLQNATLRQLQALLLFASTAEIVVTSEDISKSTSTAEPKALAGLVSSLAKIKTSKGQLLLRIGRIPGEGTRWRLNEEVISKKELNNLLEKYYLSKSGLKWAGK